MFRVDQVVVPEKKDGQTIIKVIPPPPTKPYTQGEMAAIKNRITTLLSKP